MVPTTASAPLTTRT